MTDDFIYRDADLFAEDVQVSDIVAAMGTPCYIYSAATITRNYQQLEQAFSSHPHQICYAVKANSNLAVLNLLSDLGAGFDVVSKGELTRVLAAQGSAHNVVFSGVGKQADEIAFALDQGIYCFNIESAAELNCIQEIAHHKNKKAPIAIRVNPDIDAKSHPYVVTGLKESKFGVPHQDALALFQAADRMSHIDILGLDYHIGSQLTELGPFVDAMIRMRALIEQLYALNISLSHLDIGGGLGVQYHQESPPSPQAYAQAILEHFPKRDLKLIIEPGRAIVAQAGILVTQIIYLKQNTDNNFCIVDAGMNDLIRPSLYSAWHDIIPVHIHPAEKVPAKRYNVVGPVCESGDFMGLKRSLKITQGDYLAIKSTGAYGFTMSSNYNTRPRAPEVMVKEKEFRCIRTRETIETLTQGECIWADT